MTNAIRSELVDILLVEDSPGDIRLTREALKEARVANRVHVARDGIEAMDFLHQRGSYFESPRPDLVLLDLNLPRMDGRKVLAEIKNDPGLSSIPIIILTTSDSEADVRRTYQLHANCYLVKPLDVNLFFNQIRSLEDFWLANVRLPSKSPEDADG